MKRQSENESSSENVMHHTNVDCKIDSEKKVLDLVKKQDKCQIKSTKLSKKTKTKKCKKKHETSLTDTDQTLLNNGIIRKHDISFSCTFCKRSFPSLHDTLSHIKGKFHATVLKGQRQNSINDSITHDKKLLTNSTQKGEYLIDNISEDRNNSAQDKNNSIVENCSYYCELCDAQIDIDCVIDHINTVTHKCNICSVTMGDNMILYKCLCCKSIIQGNSLFINHLCLETHLNNLASTLKDIKTSGGTQSMLLNKKFELCNVLISKMDNETTYFTEKCLIFFDTSVVNLSNGIKNNIPYSCSLCSAKLNTEHNLIEHCKGRIHMYMIKQLFFGKTHSSVNNNTMSILDRFNEISITDEKPCIVKTLGIDSTIPNDVHREITKYLGVSPVLLPASKQMQNKRPPVWECLNKVYHKRYLEIEEEMYTLSKQKLANIESNVKLLMPQNKKNLYCMVCNTSVSNDLHLLYEHVHLTSHTVNVNQVKDNVDVQKLLKQCMRNISEHTIKCYPCATFLHNHPIMIDTHIKSQMHKKNYKKFYTVIDSMYNCMLEDLNRLWYSIQRFSCTVCKTGYKYKLEFIEHIFTKHSPLQENHIFDFCIPCATLWLGQIDCYTQHCSDIMHKYLVKRKDFMVEDLPECIKKLLTQVDETANILIQQTQVLSNDNIQEEVVQSLENSIKSYYPSVKASLFGSRVTGLGFTNSDIDIYLDCEDTCSKDEIKRSKTRLKCIRQALHQRKEEWELTAILEETRTPIIKLIYKRTGVHCDVTVTSSLAVENSKLIRSFNDAYPPCRKLILFIKKWFSLFSLPAKNGFTNYSLVWLVIFYLQGESYLPSVATLIKEHNNSRLVCGWETGVAEPKSSDKPVRPISALLLDFFKFYANFDYQHYVVCPLMGYSLPKTAFVELNTLPKEMKLYVERLGTSDKPEYFRIDSSLCVQDPFDLSHNLTKAVNSITLKCFKQYCQDSAAILLSKVE